jgi:hydroxyacylglutathione hydrolase
MITIQKIDESIYHFRDPLGVNFTYVQGSKKGLLFDTGYGFYDTKKIIDEIATTPYLVINSHGHFDHTCGNFRFPCVYLNPIDFPLCQEHTSPTFRSNALKRAKALGIWDVSKDDSEYLNLGCKNILPLDITKEIDLGNLHVQIISMPGHTKGSIGLLLKEKRFLLTADAAISNIWLFLKESTTKNEYIDMLKKVSLLPFDSFLTGHLPNVFDKHFFDYYITVAENANPQNSKKVCFEGFERPNTYQYSEIHEGITIGICFQDPKE